MTTGSTSLAGRRFVDESGNPVVPGRKLGEGGEGVVHLVDGDPGLVLKIWHQGKTPQDADAKIRHLVSNPVEPEPGVTWHITWPQYLVTENGAIAGYTMPILNPDEDWEAIVEYYNRRSARTTGAAQGRELRIDDRVRMARNLALGFKAVHEAGYVIGDVNEKNVEVNRQNDIAMVDCDSYGFTDSATGRTFANNMGRPEFQAPEVQGDYNNRTQEQDLFGLAVIIFHLLTGYHPYTVNNRPNISMPGERISNWLFPPAGRGLTAPDTYNETWDALTDKQKELFLRCFDKKNEGQPRPKPDEWVDALLEMPAVVTQPTPASATPGSAATSPGVPPTPVSPRPAPTPARSPGQRRRPRRFSGGPTTVPADWLLWVMAVGGYGALIPLTIFGDFRPWLWLWLMLVSAALLYFPVRRLLEFPITGLRWGIIAVAVFVGIMFALGLAETAISVWPWWMWLGAGLAVAFVFLVPARGAFSSSNVRRRYVAIGAASLVTLFILGGLGAAGFRAWEDWRWQRSLDAAGAGDTAAPAVAGNAALAGGGAAGGAAQVPAAVPVVAPTDTPKPAPTETPIPPTDTPPPPTATDIPIPTDTPAPTPTEVPLPTDTPIPAPTPVAVVVPDPVLAVLPGAANPGEVVTVELTGFPPYTLVHQVTIEGFDVLGDRTINTDANGDARIDNIVVPVIMDAGIYEVWAAVGDLNLTVGQLAVVAIPPTPTPPPYPDPALLAQRGPPPGHLSRAPGVSQYVSGCFVGAQARQEYWMYLADWPSETLENARNPILLEFRKSIPKEELREVLPGKCYYVGPVTYQTDESVKRCPGAVYDAGCSGDELRSDSFRVYVTEGALREITETPQFGN